jgi:hypothetical protein
MSETRHTPTPWETSYRERSNGSYGQDIYDSNGATIATCEWYSVPTPTGFVTNRTANAEFIVRAVNSHTDLLALVKEASEIMNITYAGNFPAGIESFLVRAHAALQHAEAR